MSRPYQCLISMPMRPQNSVSQRPHFSINAGRQIKALAEASAAVCTMESRNACNLLTVQLHTGLAALRMNRVNTRRQPDI